jgi:ribosomal protein L7/L12
LHVDGGARGRYREEERLTLIVHVGPSNVTRIREGLVAHGAASPVEAEELSRAGRHEVDVGDGAGRGAALRAAFEEGGAAVEVITRIERIAIPPDVAVHLDDAGTRKIAVIAALREHTDLGIAEARPLVERAAGVVVWKGSPRARGGTSFGPEGVRGARARRAGGMSRGPRSDSNAR